MTRKLQRLGGGVLVIFMLVSVSTFATSQRELSISVYMEAPAFISQQSDIELEEGINEIELDVPHDVLYRSIFVSGDGGEIRSWSVSPAINSKSDLLKEFIGDTIRVIICRGGTCSFKQGELISILNSEPLLRLRDGETVLLSPPDSYYFPSLDRGRFVPTLNVKVMSKSSAEITLSLGYKMENLRWSCSYDLIYDEGEGEIDLTGVAHVVNNSDSSFVHSDLTLVAGKPLARDSGPTMRLMSKAEGEAESPAVSSAPLFEYHSYHVNYPVDLAGDSSVNLPLISSDKVSVAKQYVYERARYPGILAQLEFENTEENGLGQPLPSGAVSVYKEGETGLKFIGEDSITDTPSDQPVTLSLGRAFDILGQATVLDRTKVGDNIYREKVEIELTNRKDGAVTVEVIENLRGTWEILNASEKYEQLDSQRVSFVIDVEGDSVRSFTYTYQYRY